MSRRPGTAAHVAVASYAGIVLGVLTGPILARQLGTDGRGQLAAAFSYYAFLSTVAALGVPVAVAHLSATTQAAPGALLGSATRFALGSMAFCILAAGAVVLGPLHDFPDGSRVWIFLLLATIPAGTIAASALALLQTAGRLRTFAVLRFVPFGANALAVVLLAATDRLEVGTVLAAQVVFGVAHAAACAASIRGRTFGEPGAWRPMARFGVKASFGSLASFVNGRVDQLLIAPVLGSSALGLYATSASVAGLPVGIAQAISSSGQAAVARAETEAERVEAAVLSTRRSIAAASLLAIGLAIVAPTLVPWLYGTDFDGAVVPLMVLLPATVFLSGSITLGPALATSGHPAVGSLAELVSLVVTVVGLAVALPHGIIAVAAVSLVAYAAAFAVLCIRVRQMTSLVPLPRARDFLFVMDRALIGPLRGLGRTRLLSRS